MTTVNAPSTLTEYRKVQVLRGIARGKTRSAIGRELGISAHTVHMYTTRLFVDLGVKCAAEAVDMGWRLGILKADS